MIGVSLLIWLCTREDCKVSRSIHANTGLLKEYQCEHIELAKNYPNASPLRVFTPVLDAYPCSDSIRLELSGIIESLPSNTPSVVQVSEQTAFGSATASNQLGSKCRRLEMMHRVNLAQNPLLPAPREGREGRSRANLRSGGFSFWKEEGKRHLYMGLIELELILVYNATKSISTSPWMGYQSIAGLPPNNKFTRIQFITPIHWINHYQWIAVADPDLELRGGGGPVLIYLPWRPFSLQSFLLFYPK